MMDSRPLSSAFVVIKSKSVLIICNISLDLHCIVLRIVLIIQSTSVYIKDELNV